MLDEKLEISRSPLDDIMTDFSKKSQSKIYHVPITTKKVTEKPQI